MPWELVLIVAGTLWLCLGAAAVALCVMASRGDRQLYEGPLDRRKTPRSGRFRRQRPPVESLR